MELIESNKITNQNQKKTGKWVSLFCTLGPLGYNFTGQFENISIQSTQNSVFTFIRF